MIQVHNLVPVKAYAVKANRAESGSPVWKTFYFLTPEELESFLNANDCLGLALDCVIYQDPSSGEHFVLGEEQ